MRKYSHYSPRPCHVSPSLRTNLHRLPTRSQYSHRVFTSLTLQIPVLAQGLYLSYITDYSTRTGSLPLLHYRSQYSHRVFTSPLRHIPRNMAPDKQDDLPPTTSRGSLRVPRLVLILSSPLLVHRSGARSGRVSCRAPTGWVHRH